jgi:hypothetical protein
MVPEEWPIAAEAADPPVESARPRGPSRLASVRRDFFLDPTERLTEQERALMTAMLHDLIGTIVGENLAALAGAGGAAPEVPELASRLSAAGLLDRPDLVALLLRRADEHRIGSAYAGRAGPRRLPLLPMLVGDSESSIASAAMAVVVARGRRRDPFGQPRIELSDLTPEDAGALVNAVAAALADPTDATNSALANAAEAVLAGHDVRESLDSTVAALVEALGKAGRANEALVETAAEEGEAAILAGLLARQAAIDPAIAWDLLVNDGNGRLALLARMAGLGRQTAARLLAELGTLTGAAMVEEEIARFDAFDDETVKAALAWWRLPEMFRAARAVIRGGRG